MTSPAPPSGRAAQPSGDSQRPRVLVIDDDAETGKVIGRMLAERYDVVFAQSAVGALGRIMAGGRFGAIVCDFRMPSMNGIEFYDEVARVAPTMAHRIVYVTGVAGTEEFVEFVGRTGCNFLEKPLDPGQLRHVVSALNAMPLDG